MNRDRDEALDELLAGIKTSPVSELEQARWRLAVEKELRARPSRAIARWLQVAAALAVGFLLGAATMRFHAPPQVASSDDATIQYVYAKSE